MATSITSQFEQICFSSRLPDPVTILTDAKSIKVSLCQKYDYFFEATYYPYNRTVYVRDIRSLIEAFMFEQSLDIASIDIEVDDGSGSIVRQQGVEVIRCSLKTRLETFSFISSNFLTTRKHAVVPRSGHVILANYTKAYEQGLNFALIHYSKPHIPGQMYQYNWYLGKVQSEHAGIISKRLTYDFFRNAVLENAGASNCVVHGVEYQIGGRKFNIFYTDEEPNGIFEFINAFGMQETAYIYGVSTTKTEVEHSEAICNRRISFYDENVKVKHEVETAPMPYDDALWLNQMLYSKWVARYVDDRNIQVLISDITSEVDDNYKDMVKLKFSWRYADGEEWL